MRVLPIGYSGKLMVISHTELETLHKKSKKEGSFCLLEDSEGAPGYALLVERDEDHARRRKPGDPPPTRKPARVMASRNKKSSTRGQREFLMEKAVST